jgi:hypothetical protein
MSNEHNLSDKPQNNIQTTDEMADEALEDVVGGTKVSEIVVTKSTDSSSPILFQSSPTSNPQK